jgi:hypothetical protein
VLKELLKNDGACPIEEVPPKQKCPNPNQDVSGSLAKKKGQFQQPGR